MLLTQSAMGWIVLAVLSLCLPVWSAVRVTQPYRVLSTNGTAQIRCVIHPQPAFHQVQPSQEHLRYPYPDPVDLRVALLKGLHGNQKLCLTTLNFSEQNEAEQLREGEVQCSAQVRGGAVELTVAGLKAADTDIYRCEIQVNYPPPYLKLTGNGTLVHVADSQLCPMRTAERQQSEDEQEDDEEQEEGDEKMEPVSVSVVALVIAIISVLIIIICFQTLRCERGRRKVVWTLPTVEHHKVDAIPFMSENIA